MKPSCFWSYKEILDYMNNIKTLFPCALVLVCGVSGEKYLVETVTKTKNYEGGDYSGEGGILFSLVQNWTLEQPKNPTNKHPL